MIDNDIDFDFDTNTYKKRNGEPLTPEEIEYLKFKTAIASRIIEYEPYCND